MPAHRSDGTPWPRISVVTPSFNQVQYVEETVRSVLLQGYPNLEYIVLDGGSTDGSLEIIRRYEPWLAALVSEPDRGQTDAINKGWRRATGEILAWINTDDVYCPDALARAGEAFGALPGAGMVYGSALVVDEAGRPLRTWEAHPFDFRRMLVEGSIVPQSSAFFAAAAIQAVGDLDEQWDAIMDYEFCLRVGLRFPARCIPEVLTRFRDHPGSKTRRRFDVMARELIRFVRGFETDAVDQHVLAGIRRQSLGRIHYEWAMACLSDGRHQGTEAQRQLRHSLRRSPGFALRRPQHSAYIVKEVARGEIARRVRDLGAIQDGGSRR
jgi:glycosyltransferase involved in cell wall biosynthesis